MTDFAISNETVFPSVNDVAATAGDGNCLRELQLTKWTNSFISGIGRNFVVSGFAIPASSANLTITVPLGEAFIGGYRVSVPAGTAIAAVASTTSHVYLKATRDGSSNVSGASIEVNTTGTPPTDSVKLGTLIASGSAITSTTDARPFYPLRRIPQTQVFTAGGTFTVPTGVTEIAVEVFGASGGGGGGGGTDSSVGTNPGGRGGRGGDGGYAQATLTVVPGQQLSVAIGAAGSNGGAGGAGTGNPGGAGTGGGSTSIGSVSASGGGGGGAGGGPGASSTANSADGSDGAPGVGSSGDLNLTGGGASGGAGGGSGADGGVGAAGRVIVRY